MKRLIKSLLLTLLYFLCVALFIGFLELIFMMGIVAFFSIIGIVIFIGTFLCFYSQFGER